MPTTYLSTRRRRVALYLVALAATAALVTATATAATPFVDINGNQHAGDIDAIYNAGVTLGCDATHYCPNEPVRRDQMAAFLARGAALSSATTKRFPITNARSATQTFCSLAASSPRSFEAGPCLGTVLNVDGGSVGSDASIAIGADELPVVSYFDAKNGDLKVARCANASCTAGATIATVDAAGVVGRHSSIAIGADGFPLISYYDVTNGDLKVAHCVNLACSGNVTTVSTIDSGGDVGQFSSLAIGADGVGVISYFDATNADLKVARCTATACTSATRLLLDGGGVVGQYTSIAIGADNLAAISYFDATNSRLKFTRCANTACSSGASTVTLDPNAMAGMFSSITVGTDGLPLIAYYDKGAGDLKVAHCGNTICSANLTYAAVDVQGDVGRYASIAIGTDGKPIVASYRADGGNLRIARCLNLTCSASTLRSIDSDGDVGSFASIAVGVDGIPVIAYHDPGRGHLKVARPPAA